jgi:hypothetical protein
VDVAAVFTGLANKAATITGLRCFDFTPDSIPEPCFYVHDVDIDYDVAFSGGMDQFIVKCRLLVSHADDRAGQKSLKDYLRAAGPKSVKAALEASPRTLGGACDDLNVQSASGYGLYEHAGTHYYGAEFTVLVIGPGN